MVRAAVYDEFSYVLRCDRSAPAEERVTFRLKPLTSRERGDAVAAIQSTGDPSGKDSVEFTKRVLGWGLMGWDNLKDQDGGEVAFRSSMKGGRRIVEERCYDAIFPYVEELSEALLQNSELSEDQEKNS